MMFIALMMRPWLIIMQSQNIKPRTLADDLLILAYGPNHRADLINATQATRDYLADMGAKVATSKSILFASTEQTRLYLKKFVWPYAATTNRC